MAVTPNEIEPTASRNGRELNIDFNRIAALIRRRRGRLIFVGVFTFVAVTFACAFFVPQSFTSQISLSFPQSAQPTALSMLTGAGSGNSRYVGVLKSRRFAEEVERRVGVKSLCGFKTREEAIEAIVKGVNINDNARDSLVYLSIALPGPPRLGSSAQRARVKEASAKAANAYSKVLYEYMATSDTDRDAVLLRAAEYQLKKAKGEYEQAVAKLGDFVVKPRNQSASVAATGDAEDVDISSGPGSVAKTESSHSALSTTAARELETLYVERGKLEAEIQSASAAQQAGDTLRRGQISRLNNLPDEDPLLATARSMVTSARIARDTLATQLGPDNPELLRAQERLKIAEANLRKQKTAIVQRDTTEDVAATVTLKSLNARAETVNRLIATAEKKAQKGLAFSQQFEQKRNDVLLRLEVLKATASQAAVLSLQTISLKNRMTVVDTAELAKTGSPNLIIFCFIGLVVTAIVLSVYLAALSGKERERQQAVEAPSVARTLQTEARVD